MVKLKNVKADTGLIAYQKVQAWFFAYPTKEFTLNEIYKAVGIAKTTASQTVQQLAAENFLVKETIGNLWRIKANQGHPDFVIRKIPHNLQLVYESGIVEYTKSLFPQSRAIILFGSYRKGDDTHESDIDIAVEVLDDKELRTSEIGGIHELGYRKNVKVNAHIFSRNKIDINVFTSIANGILLDGLLEVRP